MNQPLFPFAASSPTSHKHLLALPHLQATLLLLLSTGKVNTTVPDYYYFFKLILAVIMEMLLCEID